MSRTCTMCAVIVVLFLAACGGGGFSRQPSVEQRPPDTRQPVLAPEAKQAPIIPLYRLQEQSADWWQIGATVAIVDPLPDDVIVRTNHETTSIAHTTVAPRPVVVDAIEGFLDEVNGEAFFRSPPLVRIADQGEEFAGYVLRTVQLINSALPNDFKIRVDTTPFTHSSGSAPPRGEIHLEVAPEHAWPRSLPGDQLGATLWYTNESARIYVDTDFLRRRPSDEAMMRLLAHEFLHAMGMQGHLEFASPLVQEATLLVPNLHERPGHLGLTILFPLDIWGLREMYDSGSYGDWNTASFQVDACMDGNAVCFGAAKLQGDATPYAANGGVAPHTFLEDNPALTGSATWRGRLVGLTPAEQVVGGRARLGINLGTLDGDLAFTGLESWAVGEAPGDVGSGTQWRDGDLVYGVRASGNTFIQDGTGDAGVVTGMFAGRSHEYMTGVLERDDLAAGFGGKR